MIDQTTAIVVRNIVRRESVSLLAYAGESKLWTPFRNRAAETLLREMIAAEKVILDTLQQLLARQKGASSGSGTFPVEFTSLNYTSLEKLLPRLIDCQKRSIAELEIEIPSLSGGSVRKLLEKLLLLKREHEVKLQMLFPNPPFPTE